MEIDLIAGRRTKEIGVRKVVGATVTGIRITPGVGIYILSGMISFAVAWLTNSFESLKAARRNPVDTLRSE